jgi:ParB family chromosome partitioning protein
MTATLLPQEKILYHEMTFKTSEVIVDNEFQIRENIELTLPEAAQSIKEHGLQEKPKARLDEQGRPHIFAGFRRFLAIRDVLKYEVVKLDVAEIDEKQAALLMSVENIDRKNYSPMEEARAYWLALKKGWTAKELAAKWKHKPEFIEKRVKLLDLPAEVCQIIHRGKIGVDTAIELLAIPTPDLQKSTARHIEGQHMALKEAKQSIREIIDEYEEWQEFNRIVEAAERKTCPTCKRPAFKSVKGYPLAPDEAKKARWITCQEMNDYTGQHIWNLKTGQTLADKRKADEIKEVKEGKAEKKPKQVIRVFRYQAPLEVIGPALIEKGLEMALKQLKAKKIKQNLEVIVDGWVLTVKLDGPFANFHLWPEGLNKGGVDINVERKIYGDKKGNKTKVGSGSWGGQKVVDKGNEKALRFLESLDPVRAYRKSLKTQARLK